MTITSPHPLARNTSPTIEWYSIRTSHYQGVGRWKIGGRSQSQQTCNWGIQFSPILGPWGSKELSMSCKRSAKLVGALVQLQQRLVAASCGRILKVLCGSYLIEIHVIQCRDHLSSEWMPVVLLMSVVLMI